MTNNILVYDVRPITSKPTYLTALRVLTSSEIIIFYIVDIAFYAFFVSVGVAENVVVDTDFTVGGSGEWAVVEKGTTLYEYMGNDTYTLLLVSREAAEVAEVGEVESAGTDDIEEEIR